MITETTTLTTKQKELYAAANLLSTNCDNQIGCFDCAFQIDGGDCLLNKEPGGWPIFNVTQWSEADITMAKALQMMGYTEFTCFNDNKGGRIVIVRRNTEDELLIDSLPVRSFLGAEDSVLYKLEQVIKEGVYR